MTSSCSHRWPCSLYGNTWTKFKSKSGWLCRRYVCWILKPSFANMHTRGSWYNPLSHCILLICIQVFRLSYCQTFHPNDHHKVEGACHDFLRALQGYKPEFLQKPKIHLLLHLADNMLEFGPTASFNTERWWDYLTTCPYCMHEGSIMIHNPCRCDSFNGILRSYNEHGNRRASSRDIATRFAVVEQLRFICSGGVVREEAMSW